MVSGQVGSGKTTLLLAILNETTTFRGKINVHGRIAYVHAEPFIFTGTILDNILFGNPYDYEKLNEILELTLLK